MCSEPIIEAIAPPVENAPAEPVITVRELGKCYQLYTRPSLRLLQSLLGPRFRFYSEFWALREVSFTLRRGESLGIVGRNGSGKSTLLQLIAGTLKPSLGSAQRHGRVAALLELGSGFNPEFSGRQNVYLNASILGLTREQIDARIESILAYADIGEFVDQPVRNYSTGMVMRLAFAVVVHVDADVLIIDEALAVGDAFFMQKCMRYLREFRQRGTLLFVSHDGGAITGLCDRAIWLERGRVQKIGRAREVMEAYMEAALIERSGLLAGVHQAGAGRPSAAMSPPSRDPRLDLIARSQLRNDIEVCLFDPQQAGFGEGRARVMQVLLCLHDGRAVSQVIGGEPVRLLIELEVAQPLDNLIVGFYLKDRLGQLLFGDNTFLSHMDGFPAQPGERLRASFAFDMPRLTNGDYFIAVGVAEGTQEQHVVQHWLHEALRLSASGGSMSAGIIGLPMHESRLERIGDA
jgi:lipopolysaccharide transport system ATP-binding protein